MKKLLLSSIVALVVLALVASVVVAQDSSLPPGGDGGLPSEIELPVVLLWLFSGGGATVVSYWLMGKGFLATLPSEQKRYVSMGLAALLACVAFVAAVALGYADEPAGSKAWLEQLFAIAGLAITGGQALHGRLNLHSR